MGIRHLNRIWVFMVIATLITFTLGESGLTRMGSAWTVSLMFLLAYAKGIIVILDFMELRHAPTMWRVVLVGWSTITVLGILLAWWIGQH